MCHNSAMKFLVGLLVCVFSYSALAAGLGTDPFTKPPAGTTASPTATIPAPVKPASPSATPAPSQKPLSSPSQIPASPIKPKK